jgi:hypothetical protein
VISWIIRSVKIQRSALAGQLEKLIVNTTVYQRIVTLLKEREQFLNIDPNLADLYTQELDLIDHHHLPKGTVDNINIKIACVHTGESVPERLVILIRYHSLDRDERGYYLGWQDVVAVVTAAANSNGFSITITPNGNNNEENCVLQALCEALSSVE